MARNDDVTPVESDIGSFPVRHDPEPYKRRKAFVKKKVSITFKLDADSEAEAVSLQQKLADHLKSGKPVEDFRVYG